MARALGEVIDPELGLDVVSLGLVYAIEVDGDGVVVRMTTTSEACPMGEVLLEGAAAVLGARFPGAAVSVVPAEGPPWEPGMLSAAARRALGLQA